MSVFNFVRRKAADQVAEGVNVLAVLKSRLGQFDKLPTLPDAAVRALAIARDPDCSLRRLAEVIERDPALTAGILRLANSPLYQAGRSLARLDQALVRLGLRECQNLLIAVGMRSLFRKQSGAEARQCRLLWQHSFLTACLCRRLNGVLDLGFQGEEFSCGIAHDIGRVLIATGAPGPFDQADPLDFVEGPHALAREQSILGTDHCYFGAWYAHLNHLPNALVSAIQYHHSPAEGGEYAVLCGLVATADQMANHIQRGGRPEDHDLAGNEGWVSLQGSLAAEDSSRLEQSVLTAMAEAAEEAVDVGAPLPAGHTQA